jgi:hypothetical protein
MSDGNYYLSAYDLYLQGREALHRFTKESIVEATPLLLQAVAKDLTLAGASVELAAAHHLSMSSAQTWRKRGQRQRRSRRWNVL